MVKAGKGTKTELERGIATLQVLWATCEEQGGRVKAKPVRDNKRRYLS
jgi:hypothetical protein